MKSQLVTKLCSRIKVKFLPFQFRCVFLSQSVKLRYLIKANKNVYCVYFVYISGEITISVSQCGANVIN